MNSETRQKVIDVLKTFVIAPIVEPVFIRETVEALALNVANRQKDIAAQDKANGQTHQRKDTRRELIALQKAVEGLSPDARATLSLFLVPEIQAACGDSKGWVGRVGPDVDGLGRAVEMALQTTTRQTRAQAKDTSVLRMFIREAGHVFVMLGYDKISLKEDGRFANFVKALDDALDTCVMPEYFGRHMRDATGATKADRQAFVSNYIKTLGRQKVLVG